MHRWIIFERYYFIFMKTTKCVPKPLWPRLSDFIIDSWNTRFATKPNHTRFPVLRYEIILQQTKYLNYRCVHLLKQDTKFSSFPNHPGDLRDVSPAPTTPWLLWPSVGSDHWCPRGQMLTVAQPRRFANTSDKTAQPTEEKILSPVLLN